MRKFEIFLQKEEKMMFWTNFDKLCKKKGRFANAIAKDLNISSGSITNWKKAISQIMIS